MHHKPAALLLCAVLVACGGGGGSSSSGNNVSATSATVVPEFTRGFAQFTGTPSATAAGDVDGDRADDIVVVTSDQLATGAGSEQLYVFYQRPDGPLVKFASTAPSGTGDKTLSAAVCDIDGDGSAEILVGYALGDLGIYKPAADGTPVLSRTLAGARSATIACVDVDGDGLSDVVTTGKPGVTAQVFLQRNGALVEQPSLMNDLVVGSLDVGDVDGDGKADLVFFAQAGATGLYAQLQTNNGGFAAPAALAFPADEFGDVRANRVAVAPLMAGKRTITASLSASRIVADTQSLATSGAAGDLRIRDLNGDGRPDVAVVHAGMVGVYYQNADGTFSAEQALYTYPSDPWIGVPTLAFGDFDADGKLDVAVASQTALLIFFQE